MIDAQILDTLSDQIEHKLAATSTPATVVGSRVLPQFVEFMARPVRGTTINALKARSGDIALALGRQGVRIVQSGTHVAIQVPIQERRTVKASALMKNLQDKHCALLGQDEYGQTIQVRISSPSVSHILISGTTGSGKTELAKTMLSTLAARSKPHQMSFIVVDPKRRDDKTFENLIADHLLLPIAYNQAVIENTLSYVVNIIDRRTVGNPNNVRLVVLVDEMADVCAMGGADVVNMLTHIVARGREVDCHLIACTQKPTARSIDTVMKANFPFRVVLKVMSQDDAKVATGISGTGAEALAGNGDAIACYSGLTRRFQAALCDLIPAPRTTALPVALPAPAPQIEKYSPKDASNALQCHIAQILNETSGLDSLRSLQRHVSTRTGKVYSGGANYWLFVEAAAAVGFKLAVESWEKHNE